MTADYKSAMQTMLGVEEPDAPRNAAADETGVESVRHIASALTRAHRALREELIAFIHAQTPEFFESMVLDVLLAMGYAGRRRDLARRLGRRGDGGVDGMLALDELGLDVIYVQAKRLRPGNAVPVSDVRDFVGSLEAHHATKGVFIATSHFTGSARSVVRQISRRVALVDGVGMADLMIRHNIGVRTAESYQLKKLDTDYFAAGARRISEISSASIQPRR